MKMKELLLWFGIVLLFGILFFGNNFGLDIFSTVSERDLTQTQCKDKNIDCFFVADIAGRLVQCDIGANDVCLCEFQSYSRNACPSGSTPTNVIEKDTQVTLAKEQGVLINTQERLMKTKIGLAGFKVPASLIAVTIVIMIFAIFGTRKGGKQNC